MLEHNDQNAAALRSNGARNMNANNAQLYPREVGPGRYANCKNHII